MAREPWSYYTVEEYLEAEETASDKHEYYRGEIYLMASGSPRHSVIGANVIIELGLAFRKKYKDCLVYTSDIKVHVPTETYFTYPDAAIICGEPKMHPLSRTTVENPLLIAEVLSPSTADHDRTTKFNLYSRLETLEHYLLIDQERVGVEYRWLDKNGLWQSAYYESRDDFIQLAGYDLQLSVAEFYYGMICKRHSKLPQCKKLFPLECAANPSSIEALVGTDALVFQLQAIFLINEYER